MSEILTTPSRLRLPNTTARSNNSATRPKLEIKTPTFAPSSVLTNITNDNSIIARSPASFKFKPSSNASTPVTTYFNNQQGVVQGNNVKVVARFRPFNDSERVSNNILQFQPLPSNTVSINCRSYQGSFTFDRVFDHNTTQLQLYEEAVADTVEDLFKGFNGTVLSYGQTGSGKTFTMMGVSVDSQLKGIIPRICEQVFQRLVDTDTTQFSVSLSYLEIYNEKLIDLLNDQPNYVPELKIIEDKENGIHVKNLVTKEVWNKNQIYQLIDKGNLLRKVALTKMNEASSRSHSIFQINLTQTMKVKGVTKLSKLYLVDLAGSEKIEKTGAVGQTLEELKKINTSLSCLGNVINALTDGKVKHVPYRDSKLTRILQESLGGNSRTTLIINCSMSSLNDSETLSTLRFGARLKRIQNYAHVNEKVTISQLQKEKDEDRLYIATLELKLLEANNQLNSDSPMNSTFEELELRDLLNEKSREMEQLEISKDQELINLKMRVAELETRNDTLCIDLKRELELKYVQQKNSENNIDRERFDKLFDKYQDLNIKFLQLQNQNNDLNLLVKKMDRTIKEKNNKIAEYESMMSLRAQRGSMSSSLSSPGSSPTSLTSPNGTVQVVKRRGSGRPGLNLKLMKSLIVSDGSIEE